MALADVEEKPQPICNKRPLGPGGDGPLINGVLTETGGPCIKSGAQRVAGLGRYKVYRPGKGRASKQGGLRAPGHLNALQA